MQTSLYSPMQPLPHSQGTRRPLATTLRRHRFVLMSLVCGVASLVYLAAPMLGRTYRLSGTVEVGGVNGGMEKLAEKTVGEVEKGLPGVDAELQRREQGMTLSLHTAAPARDSAQVRLMTFAQQFGTNLKNAVEDRLADQRRELGQQVAALTDRDEALTKQITAFRATHHGVLPDDPTSVTAQYEKLSGRLDEKEQRLRLVSGQLVRLEEYKKNKAKATDVVPPPPTPLPPPNAEAAAPVKPENDPEVVALTAQLQLLNDQVEEMLKTRTEQHPYVQDLRSQMAGVQKKLDAAKQRAAAGVPAPVTARSRTAAVVPADPSLAAALQVDLQIEALQAEKSTLEPEIKTLTGQRDALQKQVEQVGPARREFEELTSTQDAGRKSRQQLKERLDQLNGMKTAPVEVSALAMEQGSSLPSFPRLSVIYPLGMLLGLAVAMGVAQLIHRGDRSWHEVREAAEAVDVPVLGAVSEIRTPAQQMRRKAWRGIGRPLATVGLVVVLLACGALCYLRLADGATQVAGGYSTLLHVVAERP